MSTDDGTSLYVSYAVNSETTPQSEKASIEDWGEDLAGWFIIAPFPPSLFKSKQLRLFGAHMKNHVGAFHNGVTEPVKDHSGVFLSMEVLATGDIGTLLFFDSDESRDRFNKNILESVARNEALVGIEEYHLNRGGRREETQPDEAMYPEWLRSLVTVLDWHGERRTVVGERQITFPFGDFWYEVTRRNSFADTARGNPNSNPSRLDEDSFVPQPAYGLLVRPAELPILLLLVPRRPLFRMEIDVLERKRSTEPAGSGLVNEIATCLADRKINIWQAINTHRSLLFVPADSAKETKDGKQVLREVDSRISIVAAVPKASALDSSEAVSLFLDSLAEELRALRKVTPGNEGAFADLKRGLSQLNELERARLDSTRLELERRKGGLPASQKDDLARSSLLNESGIYAEVRKAIDRIAPSFVRNVEVHGPPLFRCFFSHSANPEFDERDYVDRLKALLKAEVFEVKEGLFPLGQTIEDLTRGRIRQCNLFVSFLWPREQSRTASGEFVPPEWIVHEESFATGLNIPVYQIREKSVQEPRYQQRRDFVFERGSTRSWEDVERKIRLELRRLVLEILLKTHSS